VGLELGEVDDAVHLEDGFGEPELLEDDAFGYFDSYGSVAVEDSELDVVLLAEAADAEAVEYCVWAGVARHGGALADHGLGA